MMINTILAGIGGALSVLVPAACDNEEPTRSPQVIYVGEDYNLPFDARPGDTIILVMTPDGHQLDRCNHSGGELIYNPHTLLWYCENVDF